MQQNQRRLAAILAADVAGYTRLMAADEIGTLARLQRLRAQVIEPKIAQFQGHIVGSAGDSLLVEFASAINAVQCAVEAQLGLAGENAGLPENQRMVFRMGVNLGDVIAADDTIHGDGVNIAARLEKLAEPGSVCIGRNVYDQVKGKLAYGFADLGEQRMHNIPEPVRAYCVKPSQPAGNSSSVKPLIDVPPLPDKPSIAVLPFQNMSGDAEQEYFADGMVEEIITALSHLRWLFVIARGSSFTYKGRAVDLKQVGRELGVRYVLEGSVRKAGNRLRITGQLIDAATGAHLWADKFDGELKDIFDLQDQVTSRVVGAIAPKLEQAEIERAKRKPTESLHAYDYYLRGVAGIHRWTREGNYSALPLFHRAFELDPDFASAYGMAASCYVWRKTNGWMTDRVKEKAEAERLAWLAVDLGKDDAVALCWGGITLAYVMGKAEDGAALIDQALMLDPNFAAAWGFSGWARIWLGEIEVAIEHLARAMRLSPLDPLAYNKHTANALAHFLLGRYEKSLACAEQALREQPSYGGALRLFVASSAMIGRIEEARKAVPRLLQADPTFCLSELHDRVPIRDPADLTRYAEALRLAGVPE